MNKVQVTQILKQYSWVVLCFTVSILLEVAKLVVTGLSVLHKRMTLTQETSSDPEIQEIVPDEIPINDEAVNTELHDQVPEGSSGVEDREGDYTVESIPDCFARARLVPDSVPFIVFDNQEQVESAVLKEVCNS